MSQSSPQPSDAAIAAARRLSINYLISHDRPDMDAVSERDIARDIDYHFAPLREELAQYQTDWQKIVKEVLACDPTPACKRADDQLEPPWEVIARIRAENAKLRAALEDLIDACEGLADQQAMPDESYRTKLESARASLTPPTKDTP